MQKKFLVTALAAFIPSTLVADVFLNGVLVEDFSVDYTDAGDIIITTTAASSSSSGSSSGSSSSSSSSGSSSSSSGSSSSGGGGGGSSSSSSSSGSSSSSSGSDDPVGDDGCGETPADTTAAVALDWANPGDPRIRLPRYETGGQKSSKLTTTSGRQYNGQVSVTAVTGTSGVTRRVWFSECRGGEPLNRGNCEARGTSSTTLRWKQVEPGIPWESSRCNLKTNTTYYLNYRNENCNSSSGCDVFFNNYTNNKPF